MSVQPKPHEARKRLLDGIPVTERHLQLAGISTAMLEGGEGPPLVLLHGPGEHALKWLRVLPLLLPSFKVMAPDLPGHGASEVEESALNADRVLEWLDALIARTGDVPPVLVGQIVGGAIAARYAREHSERLAHLVLIDTLGLAPFEPAPEFGRALEEYLTRPTVQTQEALWQRCAFDFEVMREQFGGRWDQFAAYTLERTSDPGVRGAMQVLMRAFGFAPMPPEDLARITVPTTLIWGRHDLATRLAIAEAVSARHGWPLTVIENAADDPAIEQPEAFVAALRAALRPLGNAARRSTSG